MQSDEYPYNSNSAYLHRYHEEDLDTLPYVKTVTIVALATLAMIIAWFALTAEKPVPTQDANSSSPSAGLTAAQLNIAENRIILSDGRLVTCLVFPAPGYTTSCDWSRAQGIAG
jgi:hypothetical protein